MDNIFIIIVIAITAYSGIRFWINVIKEAKSNPKKEKTVWLHCFNCEIEMPVKDYNGEMYCANCKLIHRISKEGCKHPNRLTQVLESSATCETTIEVCADCDEQLTEPKTDCA